MKAKDVQLGKIYVVKVSGKLARVQLTKVRAAGGWYGTNLKTGKYVLLRTAARLRQESRLCSDNELDAWIQGGIA